MVVSKPLIPGGGGTASAARFIGVLFLLLFLLTGIIILLAFCIVGIDMVLRPCHERRNGI